MGKLPRTVVPETAENIVPETGSEVTTPADKKRITEAKRRAERIRQGINKAIDLYVEAVTAQDWRYMTDTDGHPYESVKAWSQGEFGPDRFSTEKRKELVGLFSQAGYTVREIADATGASKSQVSRDQASVPNGTQENLSPRQRASREREAEFKTPVLQGEIHQHAYKAKRVRIPVGAECVCGDIMSASEQELDDLADVIMPCLDDDLTAYLVKRLTSEA